MLQQTFLDRSWRVLIVEEHDRRLVGRHPQPGETAWQDYPTVLRATTPNSVRGGGGEASRRERPGR